MAKAKSKASASIPHKNVHARVSYLYQAASYLTTSTVNKAVTSRNASSSPKSTDEKPRKAVAEQPFGQPQHLLSQLRGVVRRAQTRVRPDIKRTICKRCDCILIPGQTSTCFVENASSGGRKPWADVLVYRCNECQATKRFPVGQSPRDEKMQRIKALAGKEPSGRNASDNDIGDA